MYKTLSTIVRNLVYKKNLKGVKLPRIFNPFFKTLHLFRISICIFPTKSSFNTLTDFFPVLSKSVSTGMQPYLYVSEEHRKYIPHEMYLTLLSHRSG